MRTIEEVKKMAQKRGWCLNPDTKIVDSIIKAQNMLKEKKGEFYCPCKIKRIPENICPCKDSQEEINRDGHCHCNLYWKC